MVSYRGKMFNYFFTSKKTYLHFKKQQVGRGGPGESWGRATAQHIIACGGRRDERDGVRRERERSTLRRCRHASLRSLRSRRLLLSLSPGLHELLLRLCAIRL